MNDSIKIIFIPAFLVLFIPLLILQMAEFLVIIIIGAIIYDVILIQINKNN